MTNNYAPTINRLNRDAERLTNEARQQTGQAQRDTDALARTRRNQTS